MTLGFLVMVLCCLLLATSLEDALFFGAKPGCEQKCGNLWIPYPFGTTIECALSEHFLVRCDGSESETSPTPYLKERSNLEAKVISLTQVRIKSEMGYACYDQQTGKQTDSILMRSRISYPYIFSSVSNKFTVIGCNTFALIEGLDKQKDYISGCLSFCGSGTETVKNGLCAGAGCCQVPIPQGLNAYEMFIGTYNNNSRRLGPWKGNRCSYAFLADQNFNFQTPVLFDSSFNTSTRNVSMALGWAIGNQTCQQAQKNLTTFACRNNTRCINASENGQLGYRCNCTEGYEGNPYLSPGCQDINECDDPSYSQGQCLYGCENTPGHYNCTCPHGTTGDGRKGGRGCISVDQETKYIRVILGICLGLLLLLLAICWLYLVLKKRKLLRLKEKFFKQNGGYLLQQQLHQSRGGGRGGGGVKLFTAQELKEATNNYHEHRILGRGGNGTVYKGILLHSNNMIVAIKRSKIVDESQIEQFINEVVILTQINHKNVVKLLGCCLETQVPLLVYEFISSGTLFEHIHIDRAIGAVSSNISWSHRLRIAAETAGALAYLHSAASIPIIHRDVKSSNILLDHNYTAKIADFGASRLNPLDQTQISTLVQGTLGYLDPEYFQSSQLTDKSDVYSFGVVLVELLTGEKPLSFARSEERRNLATFFISSVQENSLLQIIEPGLVGEEEKEKEQIFAVAELAMRCMNLKGAARPTMKQVEGELERIRRLTTKARPWVEEGNPEEETTTTKNLLLATWTLSEGDSTCSYEMSSMNFPR